ncbi:MAG: permease [Nitrososphaerota archaeon]
MDEKIFRRVRTVALIIFVFVVFGLLIESRIKAYSLAPVTKPEDFSKYAWYEVPVYYLWDYIGHGWRCLLFAFVTAGLVYEFVPKEFVTKYMGSSKAVGYAIGAGLAPFFTVCSCTMVPLFAGILYTGAGIGPAITFLLMAPAANILTILITGEFLSWEIAGVRIIVSLLSAVLAGMIISKTPWGKAVEKAHQLVSQNPGTTQEIVQQKVAIVKPPLDERLMSALKFGGYLAKQILPYFIAGLIVVSYVTAYTPQEVIEGYLTGTTGILIASVAAGPLYTPTLVEIVLGKSLLDLGMSKAALLAWLMGQPWDIPNMAAVSKITGWKVVLTYALILWVCAVFFSFLYGITTSSL